MTTAPRGPQKVRPPYDASPITPQLFIAPRPRTHHVEHVGGLGVDLVLSMIWFAPPRALTRHPFRLVRLPCIDSPLFPIPLFLLRRGVAQAAPVLEAGGRVLVYCMAGRHRSVAMASSILIASGMAADDAMDLIAEKRAVADPRAWYIERQIRRFERDWLRRQGAAT